MRVLQAPEGVSPPTPPGLKGSNGTWCLKLLRQAWGTGAGVFRKRRPPRLAYCAPAAHTRLASVAVAHHSDDVAGGRLIEPESASGLTRETAHGGRCAISSFREPRRSTHKAAKLTTHHVAGHVACRSVRKSWPDCGVFPHHWVACSGSAPQHQWGAPSACHGTECQAVSVRTFSRCGVDCDRV